MTKGRNIFAQINQKQQECQCSLTCVCVGSDSSHLLPAVIGNEACALPSVEEGLFVPSALLWAWQFQRLGCHDQLQARMSSFIPPICEVFKEERSIYLKK